MSCLLLSAWSCHAQNGPTQHSATITYTQSTDAGVSANCLYRGTAAGQYIIPAVLCSNSAVTSLKDTTVVEGATYHYAVTAKVGGQESAFSADLLVGPIPRNPSAPTGMGAILAKLERALPFIFPHKEAIAKAVTQCNLEGICAVYQ